MKQKKAVKPLAIDELFSQFDANAKVADDFQKSADSSLTADSASSDAARMILSRAIACGVRA